MTTYHIQKIPVYITLALDPALTDKERSDYSGITVVGTDPSDVWWILEAENFSGQPDATIKRMIYFALKYQPRIVSIEAVAAQILFKNLLIPAFDKHGITAKIELYTESSRNSKAARIESMEPRFRNGNVRIRKGLEELISDLDNYPEIDHFDLLDSLAQHVVYSRAADPQELAPAYLAEEEFDDEDEEVNDKQTTRGSWVGLGTPRR